MPKKHTEIFEELIHVYAQDQTTSPNQNPGMVNPQDEGGEDPIQDNPGIDPNSLSTGQTIYDLSGKEYTVLEPSQDGKKQIMPADQQGQKAPTGIKQLTDNEVSTSYTISPMAKKLAGEFSKAVESATWNIQSATKDLQPFAHQESSELGGTIGSSYIDKLDELGGFLNLEKYSEKLAKISQVEGENLEINWSDFTDILTDMHSAIDQKNAKKLLEAAEDMVDLILLHINMPEDVEEQKVAEILPAFKKAQMGDLQSFHEPVRFDVEKDDESGLTIGESGFSECMECLKSMVQGKYETVDIILTLGEKFPRELANKALTEARAKGIL